MTHWIEAFSGLGLFLFGMLYLEAQIKVSAGRAFKRIVQNATGTRPKSLFTGFISTAVFQSSSVVTLMVLSLIGAGLISLQSAIAVIFGANIGTTVTAWIIGLVGFKMDIKLLAYVMIGIGGLGSVFADNEGRWKNYFGAMVGFGLIFLGLEGMKESFSVFSKTFDISSITSANPYWYALVGLALTAVIQSSSASIAIIQSALFAQMVGFEAAAAFVIGSNVGTTVTALLGAIGGIPDKKRTAMAHMIFNLSTGLVALLLMKWLVISVNTVFPHLDGVVKIALFHTIFNVIGVVLWYPFIPLLSTFVQKFFRKEPIHVTHYIQNVSTDVPDLALDALEKEIMDLAQNIEEFALLAINIPPPKALEKEMPIDKMLEHYHENFDLTYEKLYANIRMQEGEIYRYISRLSAKNIHESQQAALDTLSRKVTYLATAAKSIEDMLSDLDRLYDATSSEEQEFYKNLRYQILKGVVAYHKAREGDASAMAEMEEIYKKIAKSYRNSMKLIENMARNHAVSSEMTTITINDMHLVKSFTKSLKNTIVSTNDTMQKGDPDV